MGKYDKCFECKYYYIISMHGTCSKMGKLIPYGCECFEKLR